MTTTAAFAQEPNNAIANMTTTSENLLYEERGNTISGRVIATANDSAAIEVTYNASRIYNGTLLRDLATATHTIDNTGQLSGSGQGLLKVLLMATLQPTLCNLLAFKTHKERPMHQVR